MKKGEKRKHELLKIAYEMFLRRGYENTSVDEIIAKAQIAKGTFYYYFRSKDNLLDTLSDVLDAEYMRLAADLPEEMNAFDKLVQLLEFETSIVLSLDHGVSGCITSHTTGVERTKCKLCTRLTN